MEKGIIRLIALALLCTPLMYGCNSGDDDSSSTTSPTELATVDGSWVFTLTPVDTTDGDAATQEDVYLYEHSGVVNGYGSAFTFQGTRAGNDVVIDVVRNIDDVADLESTMNLTLTSDNDLSGAGTYTIPKIDPVRMADGTLHPKYAEPNDEWDGGEGGQIFYNVDAMRTGSAPPENVAGKMAMETVTLDVNWCDVIWSIDSFLIGKLSGNTIRPFGNCGLQKDGGGFYLAGHTGPGSIAPLWTQTVYYPIEWVWCGERSYSFQISIEGPWSGYEVLQWLHEHYTQDAEDAYGMSLEVFYQGLTDFYDTYGGFAICAGYSTRTHNTSIYLLSANGLSTETFWSTPFTLNVYDALYNQASAKGDVWVFTGSSVHDTWDLSRDLTGACGSPLLFMYVCGFNNVYFD